LAKDIYHHAVRTALEKDNWQITNDPLTLKIGRRKALVDLGAEKLLAAERKGQKIAVEIKSFLSPSPLYDLEQALGQFLLYSKILEQQEPERTLYLAITYLVFNEIFSEEIGQLMLNKTDLKLIVFNPEKEEIVQWIP
jgi:XisH protein